MIRTMLAVAGLTFLAAACFLALAFHNPLVYMGALAASIMAFAGVASLACRSA